MHLHTKHRVPVPSALIRLHCSTITASSLWPGSLSCQMSEPSLQSKFTQPVGHCVRKGWWVVVVVGMSGVHRQKTLVEVEHAQAPTSTNGRRRSFHRRE